MTSSHAHLPPAQGANPRRRAVRRRATNRPLQLLLALCSFAVFSTLPSIAEAANHRWCVRYKIDSDDRAYGDYGTAQYWMGRGVKVLVWTGDPASPYQYFDASRSTGCFDFSSPWVWGMSAWVIHEATIGKPSNLVAVRLEVPENGSAPYTEFTGINAGWDENSSKWTTTLTLDSGSNHWEEALSIPAYSIHTILNAAAYPNSFAGAYRVIQKGTQPENNAYATSAKLYAGNPFRDEKFLLGHEVGHSTSSSLGGPGGLSFDYDFYGGQPGLLAPTCRWHEGTSSTGTWGHAMRSQEYQSAAFQEAFAHFVSAIVWNSANSSVATFKYYKTNTTYGYAAESYKLTQADTWPLAWNFTPNGCDCSNLSRLNCTGSATELDWLRALWNWRALAGFQPTLPEIFTIFSKLSFGCIGTTWQNSSAGFRAATYATSSTQGIRWDSIQGNYGVDTAPPTQPVTCQ